MSKKQNEIVAEEKLLQFILFIRAEKVIVDSDLARLYGVETRRLNEEVRRNLDKFPADFMFQLTNEKLARKVDQLEHRVSDHDEILMELINEIRKLIDGPKPGKKHPIGFLRSGKGKN